MPYWGNYLCTNPEVDDDDLPLPEHRIFDDHGNLKVQIAWQVKSFPERNRHSSVTAKRSTCRLPKFLHMLFSRPKIVLTETGTLCALGAYSARRFKNNSLKRSSPQKKTSRSSSPSTSNFKKSPQRRSDIRGQAPVGVKASPDPKSPAKYQKFASTKANLRETLLSHGKRESSPVPVATSTVVLRSASASRSRSVSLVTVKKTSARTSRSRKSASPRRTPGVRSVSRRSVSRLSKKRDASQASGSPNMRWAVVALKQYAKEREISTEGLKTKSEILLAIRGAHF